MPSFRGKLIACYFIEFVRYNEIYLKMMAYERYKNSENNHYAFYLIS